MTHLGIAGSVIAGALTFALAAQGCSQANLRGTGGDGLFYCFAER
jgi:hypothetical protein